MFLTKLDAAQIHRETLVAIVESVLRPGDKKRLALELGISPGYLSYILNPGVEDMAYTKTPSLTLAQRLVDSLPLDSQIRARLWEHFCLAREHEQQALTLYLSRSRRILTPEAVADLLKEIGQAHATATHTQDLSEARRKYRVLLKACQLILERMDPAIDEVAANGPRKAVVVPPAGAPALDPFQFAQVCLYLHDVQCVLNRPDDALFHAKCARVALETATLDPSSVDRGYDDHLRVNALVAECLAYRNLGLTRQAYELSFTAEATAREIGSTEAQFWLPHVYIHRLKALVGLARFALWQVAGLVEEMRGAHTVRPRDASPRWEVHLLEAEAYAYLRYNSEESIRRSEQLLRDPVRRLNGSLQLGAVSKTVLLRTYARAKLALGERGEWEYYVQEALETAIGAGLEHQLAEIRREYGLVRLPVNN